MLVRGMATPYKRRHCVRSRDGVAGDARTELTNQLGTSTSAEAAALGLDRADGGVMVSVRPGGMRNQVGDENMVVDELTDVTILSRCRTMCRGLCEMCRDGPTA